MMEIPPPQWPPLQAVGLVDWQAGWAVGLEGFCLIFLIEKYLLVSTHDNSRFSEIPTSIVFLN